MRENGMYPVTIKKFKPGRSGKAEGRYYENIIKQEFNTNQKNIIWVGDITYLPTKIGWVYLAAIIDLYNREVIGYSVSKKMDSELVCRALGNAIARNGKGDNLVFHSNRGCQYSSKKYQQMLEKYGVSGSMSNPGYPYDNSCMESFFASLKKEFIMRKGYATMEAVEDDLFYYIEVFYNRKRLHSTLDYMSPVAFRIKKRG